MFETCVCLKGFCVLYCKGNDHGKQKGGFQYGTENDQ